MTGYYLLDNPNPSAAEWARSNGMDHSFWGYPTRSSPIRGVVLHTAENLPDYEGADTGAEAVARYLATVTRPAAYHRIYDSDSEVLLLPAAMTAFHAAGGNSAGIGISMATQAARWGERPDWELAVLRNVAHGIVDLVVRYEIPLRHIAVQQWEAGAKGFIYHSQLDPGRRTDPGAGFPLQTMFDLVEEELVVWQKIGDPIRTVQDADAVFAYQGGTIADPWAATYDPESLQEANDRLWITLARVVEELMQQDIRIRSAQGGAGPPGPPGPAGPPGKDAPIPKSFIPVFE